MSTGGPPELSVESQPFWPLFYIETGCVTLKEVIWITRPLEQNSGVLLNQRGPTDHVTDSSLGKDFSGFVMERRGLNKVIVVAEERTLCARSWPSLGSKMETC